MARQKKEPQTIDVPVDQVYMSEEVKCEAPKPAPKQKLLAKCFHMAIGVDLIGSKTSMAASRTMELEITPLGMKCISKTSGRVVLIPWPNVKGVELYPEA